MPLRLLYASASLHIHYDTAHDWLYLDWQGELTLPVAQAGWLALARCLLARRYACVLNSNAQLTRIDPQVARWLLRGVERFVQLSGVQLLAWVHAPTIHGFGFARSLATVLPRLNLSLFADVEQAVSWLAPQAASYASAGHGAHAPEALGQLHHLVQALERRQAGPANGATARPLPSTGASPWQPVGAV